MKIIIIRYIVFEKKTNKHWLNICDNLINKRLKEKKNYVD